MLHILTSSIKHMLPRKYVLYADEVYRRLTYHFYTGNKYQCPVCEQKLRSFTNLQNEEKRCPRCGSMSRDRRLWLVLKPFLTKDTHILHFSPSLCLRNKLNRYQEGIRYCASDIKGHYPAEEQLDITQLEEPSSSYDIVICYHVLEHVEDDKKAMQELIRVLRPGGKCFIQSPFKKGMIYEVWDKTTPADRKRLFGKATRVRTYSVDGLKARLQNTGFDVVATRFTEAKDNYFGLKEEEVVVTGLKH